MSRSFADENFSRIILEQAANKTASGRLNVLDAHRRHLKLHSKK